MKRIFHFLFLSILFFPTCLKAQIEKVIVETYYVSDDNDGTDTIGGLLAPGSKTYRIYIDLTPGSKITKIYGDTNHLLKISSTAGFFNNKADGKTFAKDMNRNRLKENTVALDSWLTIGQATQQGSKTYFGVLKDQDQDGSILNGNDGGSLPVDSGLLRNSDPSAGIPLFKADGLVPGTPDPSSNWVAKGPDGFGTANDSTIFGSGSAISASVFSSRNVFLQNTPGIMGEVPAGNQVLVAQLTTKGEISFELNVEIVDPSGKVIQYVSNDSILIVDEQKGLNERLSPYLKYPQVCGCKDPNYIEYKASYACEDEDACKTRVVLGCLDPMACNYDSRANFNVPDLCCYPGYCNDRDMGVVCPAVNSNRISMPGVFNLYPNPAQSSINLDVPDSDNREAQYEVYDAFGKLIISKNLGVISGSMHELLDISEFKNGIYIIRLAIGDTTNNKLFTKN